LNILGSSMDEFKKLLIHVTEKTNMAPHQEEIKDFYGKIIARIDYKSNGDQELKDYKGLILGRFLADRNITQNYSGTILSQGNTLTQLLR